MTLQRSGSITLSDIVNEFVGDPLPQGEAYPYELTDFYAGGSYVAAGTTNNPLVGASTAIPTSSEISLTDFYGASAQLLDADAGSITITNKITTIAENNTTQNFNHSISGGRFDTQTIRYSTTMGVINSITGEFVPPNVATNTTVTVTVTRTVTGDGTRARSGTSDTAVDTDTFTVTAVLDAPRNLRIANIDEDSATATWGAPSSGIVAGYTVQLKLASESWPEPTTSDNITGRTQSLTGLEPDTIYDFRVRARYSGNRFSSWVSTRFETEELAPTLPPRNLRVRNIDQDSATVSWSAPSSELLLVILFS